MRCAAVHGGEATVEYPVPRAKVLTSWGIEPFEQGGEGGSRLAKLRVVLNVLTVPARLPVCRARR
jgi:hypothetical protein